MDITTTLQLKFSLQKIFIIVICTVMGLWGVYDYRYKIPAQQRAYEQGQVFLRVKQALEAEPGSATAQEALSRARETVQDELQALVDKGSSGLEAVAGDPRQAIESIRASDDAGWFQILVIFASALGEANGRLPDQDPSPAYVQAGGLARDGVTHTADVSPPGKFDRATQWMFILCLPFAPYYTWSLLAARRRVYRLDADGTLHAPEGIWTKEEIADIDMGRWMSKSIAHVVHSDGRRIKLDDYVYRNVHLIVGAIASKRYPQEWATNARRRQAEPPASPEPAREGATEA